MAIINNRRLQVVATRGIRYFGLEDRHIIKGKVYNVQLDRETFKAIIIDEIGTKLFLENYYDHFDIIGSA